MNIGVIPENVYKRSVAKYSGALRSDLFADTKVKDDCAYLALTEGTTVASCSMELISKELPFTAIYTVVNRLSAGGSEPLGLTVSIVYPLTSEEEEIKENMKQLDSLCKELHLSILSSQVSSGAFVNHPILFVTALGIPLEKEKFLSKAVPGNDCVLTSHIGLSGTSIIARTKEQELLEKFPSKMIYDSRNFHRLLSTIHEAAPAIKSGVTAMYALSEGGIFSGLWKMAESSGVGLEINLRHIPIKQETIEICNVYDLNPYLLHSLGCTLMTTSDGNKLVMDLAKEGIEATIIGKITDSNDRVLINGDIRRFLDLPKQDELFKII